MNSTTTTSFARRALLATDDNALPELLSALLTPNGFDVHTVSPRAAATVRHNDYAILLLDGDPQTCFSAGLPAIVVIAPSNPVEAYDKGADLVIDKPLIANVLMAKIKAVLRRYGVSL